MKDRMTMTGGNKPPKEFIDYLHTLVEGVAVKGESFNKYKKWLNKYCKEFGVDYKYIETEINDFVEMLTNDKVSNDAMLKKMLYKVALNLYLTPHQTDTLLTESQAKKQKNIDAQRKTDWENAKQINTIYSYQNFINKYKEGKYIPTATQNLNSLQRAIEKQRQKEEQNKKRQQEELRRKQAEEQRKRQLASQEQQRRQAEEQKRREQEELQRRREAEQKSNQINQLRRRVNSSLTWSIVFIFLFNFLFAIFAIVQSSKAKTRLKYHDYSACEKSLKAARTHRWISFILGVIYIIFLIANS